MPDWIYWIIIAYLLVGSYFEIPSGWAWWQRLLAYLTWLPTILIVMAVFYIDDWDRRKLRRQRR